MPRAELASALPADKRPPWQACNTLGEDAVEDLAKPCADIGEAHESKSLQQHQILLQRFFS